MDYQPGYHTFHGPINIIYNLEMIHLYIIMIKEEDMVELTPEQIKDLMES